MFFINFKKYIYINELLNKNQKMVAPPNQINSHYAKSKQANHSQHLKT